MKYIGDVPVKGKAQKFGVFQVLGPARANQPTMTGIPASRNPAP